MWNLQLNPTEILIPPTHISLINFKYSEPRVLWFVFGRASRAVAALSSYARCWCNVNPPAATNWTDSPQFYKMYWIESSNTDTEKMGKMGNLIARNCSYDVDGETALWWQHSVLQLLGLKEWRLRVNANNYNNPALLGHAAINRVPYGLVYDPAMSLDQYLRYLVDDISNFDFEIFTFTFIISMIINK